MRYFKNEDPKLDGVSAQAVPTSGNFAVGDRVLYEGDTTIAGFRGYKCTDGGTAGTAACTVSQIEISSDTRWVLYKIESGDVAIGAWTIVDGHGACQGIVVSKAVAPDTYTYIVVREFYDWASEFTGTAALLYVAPTFATMA